MKVVEHYKMKQKWKNLSGNYKDFQTELDNTANGVEFINQMMKELHQIEVNSSFSMFFHVAFRYSQTPL